jgi:hypothetical protein
MGEADDTEGPAMRTFGDPDQSGDVCSVAVQPAADPDPEAKKCIWQSWIADPSECVCKLRFPGARPCKAEEAYKPLYHM